MKNLKSKIIIAIIVVIVIGVILLTGHNLINLLIKMHGG